MAIAYYVNPHEVNPTFRIYFSEKLHQRGRAIFFDRSTFSEEILRERLDESELLYDLTKVLMRVGSGVDHIVARSAYIDITRDMDMPSEAIVTRIVAVLTEKYGKGGVFRSDVKM
jgi:hypothetical protein